MIEDYTELCHVMLGSTASADGEFNQLALNLTGQCIDDDNSGVYFGNGSLRVGYLPALNGFYIALNYSGELPIYLGTQPLDTVTVTFNSTTPNRLRVEPLQMVRKQLLVSRMWSLNM